MTESKIKISNSSRNIFLIPFFFIGHFVYDAVIGYWLFGLAGGITSHPEEPVFKTYFGGTNWAFETPLFVPGSYLMAKHNIGPCMWKDSGLDLILLIIASLSTAVATGQLIQKITNKDEDKFGKFHWRLIIILFGWIFIPVPVEMTLAYEWTVLC